MAISPVNLLLISTFKVDCLCVKYKGLMEKNYPFGHLHSVVLDEIFYTYIDTQGIFYAVAASMDT